MKLQRITGREKYLHGDKHVHRQLYAADTKDGVFKFAGRYVVLSQMQPRGLWRFTGVYEQEDKLFDETYGEMPLKVAITKLRLFE